jgi:flagellar motor switch/type III secretory pathway protein FliN
MAEPTPGNVDEAVAAARTGAAEASAPETEPQHDPAINAPQDQSAAQPSVAAPGTNPSQGPMAHLSKLPDYTRSLLWIRVPVVVTLAGNRQPLHRIVELGPGSIIQFEKSCEEMLDLSVGDHLIASGEAVKVGDKFGLRITSIILPEERFRAVTKKG